MSASEVLASPSAASPGAAAVPARRLAVAWQHPTTRSIQPVGILDYDGHIYRFWYIGNVTTVTDFRPFIGFPRLGRTYVSTFLFPLFQQRVMDPRRPDFPRYIESLDLRQDATPWEQLARSQGRRNGDTIMLFPEPTIYSDGITNCSFLLHGVRHVPGTAQEVERRLANLKTGMELSLEPQEDNEWNSAAIIATRYGAIIGWVPDLLLPYVHEVRSHPGMKISVQHVNGVSAPAHLRVLVRLTGAVSPGYSAFGGERWEPLE